MPDVHCERAGATSALLRKEFLTGTDGHATWLAHVQADGPVPPGVLDPTRTVPGHFVITQDHLALHAVDSDQVLDSWSVRNVDLDSGCNPSQSVDWARRAWVEVDFVKQNASDLYALTPETSTQAALDRCIDLANTNTDLAQSSFAADEPAATIAWSVNVAALTRGACSTVGATLTVAIRYTFTR